MVILTYFLYSFTPFIHYLLLSPFQGRRRNIKKPDQRPVLTPTFLPAPIALTTEILAFLVSLFSSLHQANAFPNLPMSLFLSPTPRLHAMLFPIENSKKFVPQTALRSKIFNNSIHINNLIYSPTDQYL